MVCGLCCWVLYDSCGQERTPFVIPQTVDVVRRQCPLTWHPWMACRREGKKQSEASASKGTTRGAPMHLSFCRRLHHASLRHAECTAGLGRNMTPAILVRQLCIHAALGLTVLNSTTHGLFFPVLEMLPTVEKKVRTLPKLKYGHGGTLMAPSELEFPNHRACPPTKVDLLVWELGCGPSQPDSMTQSISGPPDA